jgi:hypothetical protein
MSHLTPEEAQRIISDWSRNKEHFQDVRNLMGALAHAEIIADAHGSATGTGFIRGSNDWNLDALYRAAVAAHPGVQAKLIARRKAKAQPQPSQQPAGRESVRDSISRAMGKSTGKPKAESVRESIRRAMKG